MASMTFQINDASTSAGVPAVWVTITENGDGTLSFSVTQQGGIIGDLRGLFFDLNDESVRSSLVVTGENTTEVKIGDDSVKDLGDGANMNGLLGSDKGYDVGIEIGTSGIGKDDIRSYDFTLGSSTRPLTLQDFANVDFGVRLTSVGTIGGSRADSSKILEQTSSAINAQDDSASVNEDATASGNVLDNDKIGLPTGDAVSVTGWSGGALGTAVVLDNSEGATLQLNADGSYVLDANAADALSQGESLTYNFTYDAKSVNEATSWSTDSATFSVTVNGVNDGPVADNDAASTAEDTVKTGSVLGNDSDIDRLDKLSVGAIAQTAITNGAGATLALNTDGTYVLDATNADALSEGETITQDFTYTLSDNHGGSTTAVLSVAVTGVNDGPTAVADTGSVSEDSTATGTTVLGNDSDIDRNDTISFTSWAAGVGTQSITGGEGATVALNADGSWALDAMAADALSAGETVSQSFGYTITDNNNATASSTLKVTVTGVNDGPVANDDSVKECVSEDASTTGTVLGNDSDIDRLDSIHVSAVNGVSDGDDGDLDDAEGSIQVQLGSGAMVTMNAAGQFTYDTNGAFEAWNDGGETTDSFVYTLSDNHGATDTAVVDLCIEGVTDDVIDPNDPAILFNHGRNSADHGFFPQTTDKDNVIEGFTDSDTLKIAGYGDLDSITISTGKFAGVGDPNIADTKFFLDIGGNSNSTRTEDWGYLADYTGLEADQITVTGNFDEANIFYA